MTDRDRRPSDRDDDLPRIGSFPERDDRVPPVRDALALRGFAEVEVSRDLDWSVDPSLMAFSIIDIDFDIALTAFHSADDGGYDSNSDAPDMTSIATRR